MFDLDSYSLLFITLAGLMTGFGKTSGLNVLGIFTTTILSLIFPAKEAVGILVLTLLMGDLIAVTYYRRTVVWKHLFSLVPWILIGIFLGYFVLLNVNNDQLKLLLGIMVLALILFQMVQDLLGSKLNKNLPNSVWFTGIIGILAGFTTMIGNVAGAVMSVYLLSRRLPKSEFVGTGAWFYLFVNVIKVPFYIHLDMISSVTLKFDSLAIPAAVIGTFIGIKVLPLIPQQLFKWIILVLGTAGAIRLIVPDMFHFILVWHITAGITSFSGGLLAMLICSRQYLRTILLRIFYSAYTILLLTTMAFAVMENEIYMLFIGVLSYCIALAGFILGKKHMFNWHITQTFGVIGTYVGLITAVIAAGGFRLAFISSSPVLIFWLVPVIIGALIIFWIVNKRNFQIDDHHSLDI